jgi:hypothetical protein
MCLNFQTIHNDYTLMHTSTEIKTGTFRPHHVTRSPESRLRKVMNHVKSGFALRDSLLPSSAFIISQTD